jgi:hypothetical protein
MEMASLTAHRLTQKQKLLVAVGASLGVGAAVVIAIAALTTWWVLLALIPLAMMVGGMAMMAAMAGWMSRGSGAAGWGCWTVSAPVAAPDPETRTERPHQRAQA